MSFKEIWVAIKTKMDEMKVTNPWVVDVYNYEVKTSESYPYISITPTNITEDVLDQLQNQSIYNFTIRVIDKNKDVAVMEARMREIVDLVLWKLREMWHQITLTDGTSIKINWSWNWGWLDEQEPLRVFNITFIWNILEYI